MDDQLYLSLSYFFESCCSLKITVLISVSIILPIMDLDPAKTPADFPKLLRAVELIWNNNIIYRNAYLDQYILKVFLLAS